jgi:hypothetical protein
MYLGFIIRSQLFIKQNKKAQARSRLWLFKLNPEASDSWKDYDLKSEIGPRDSKHRGALEMCLVTAFEIVSEQLT